MVARKRGNPLALAVLGLLWERPMHPYEMATTLRERGKEHSIKINYGSLYTVVQSLEKHGLIEPQEVTREGRRPERTVYALTEPGELEMQSWLSELIGVPVKEYTSFEAALSLMGLLPPDTVVTLLEQRRERLTLTLHTIESMLRKLDMSRAFLIESEYHQVLLRAERDWIDGLVKEIRDGTFEDLALWRRLHEERDRG
ncbi:PadR family transcriptional regulator [Bailinhaonella thermotolerans]|uniref:PadR family transcriptional regulator n=1 Tax=Bailinhaonella thermotolerans TaxID=1070861 RepID=A0A3A4A314_9ACTN|nr:PadR family transcriptional regulator [Bailinhaonella thermotolerans]RJL22825.1 PadR family transcriptional regulator [Bailinhaonella thermotolerans]